MGRTRSQRSLPAQSLPSTEAVQPCSQCQHCCSSCSTVLKQKSQLIEAEALSVSRGRGDEYGCCVTCVHSSQGATAANMTCSGTIGTPAAGSRQQFSYTAGRPGLIQQSGTILQCDKQEAQLWYQRWYRQAGSQIGAYHSSQWPQVVLFRCRFWTCLYRPQLMRTMKRSRTRCTTTFSRESKINTPKVISYWNHLSSTHLQQAAR